MRETDFGLIIYDHPGEEEIVKRLIWYGLTDLSFWGKCQMIKGIILGRPPKWVFTDWVDTKIKPIKG